VVVVLDAFYDPKIAGSEQYALNWQAVNDKYMVGDDSPFSTKDRRVFWGSYGEFDMNKAWRFYYDSDEKYERLKEIKERVDPTRVFSANSFGVGGGLKPVRLPAAARNARAELREACSDERLAVRALRRMEEHADRARAAAGVEPGARSRL
jgi:hypothetical protein